VIPPFIFDYSRLIWGSLAENMHFFADEMKQMDTGVVSSFLQQAEGIYEENIAAYVKIVLRRPFAKIIVCI
jgi:hypothetical protein